MEEQRRALAARIHKLAHIRGDFLLRSGVRSSEYFDKYLFEADPACLAGVARALAGRLPAGTELLGGLELGGVPIATLVSQHSGLPLLLIRKAAKQYGTCKLAEGPPFAEHRVLLVEDVVTSGGAVLDAAAALRKEGAVIEDVLCVIDREAGGRENLAKAGLRLDALYTASELKAAGED